MKLHGRTSTNSGPARLVCRWLGLILGTLLLPLLGVSPVFADTTVTTLGGGRLSPTGSDAGFTDGDILQSSQFRTPFGCAVDLSGGVYVADRDNGALRRLDLAANRCRTVLNGLNQPVAVAVDPTNTVYILTQADGSIRTLRRGIVSVLTSRLSVPTAMTYDGSGSLFVTQNDGSVVQVRISDGSVSAPLLAGLQQPGGIAMLDNGLLAVSETGGNRVRIWNPGTGQMVQQVGVGLSGFADGPATLARFDRPYNLAKAPGGSVIVADRGNQRVRLIEADGFVSTVYGVDPLSWEGPACVTCNPMILPGWLDGSSEFAEAREPVGVAVGNDGTIYTTEVFYHLVREVTGAAFNGGGDGGSTNIVVLPPAIAPNSGYYPMGQIITVTNPNSSSLLSNAVYYTTDGTEPTTNSFQVPMEGQLGTFLWQEKQHDLTALMLKAFVGNNASVTVSGQSVSTTEIGFPQDIAAGIGSRVIIPIVVNLRTNDQIQSLQFRVEVTPNSPTTTMIPDTFAALSVSTNDFIPLFTGATKGEALFKMAPYSVDTTRGLAITYIGTNANLLLKGFGVAALLALPIPPSAKVGDSYTVQVLSPSGTADAAQQQVTINPMPPRSVIVTDARYGVGDSSPATWYNAARMDSSGAAHPGFGDGILDNSDVNNVFVASVGLRVPFPNTDLFDAMDAFPEDTVSSAGGDGLIRFLDWQVVLMRSLGLDPARWERSWSDGGIRLTSSLPNGAAPDLPGHKLSTLLPGAVWTRQVLLFAQQVENAVPGATVDVPIYVQVAAGSELAGLAFRATVQPESTAPALDHLMQFIASPNLPAPSQSMVPSPDTVVCGWPLASESSFDPPLRGTVLLGYVRVSVPVTARSEDVYTLRFSNADGSPDLQTQYDFDTRSASLWVLTSALRPPDLTSDEWKLHFFGSTTSDAASPNADPDHDGVPNWAEYLAGTDPTDGASYLHLQSSQIDPATHTLVLRWLSAPGKVYQIESAPSLLSANWTVLTSGLTGDGSVQQWVLTYLTSNSSFFRIRLQP